MVVISSNWYMGFLLIRTKFTGLEPGKIGDQGLVLFKGQFFFFNKNAEMVSIGLYVWKGVHQYSIFQLFDNRIPGDKSDTQTCYSPIDNTPYMIDLHHIFQTGLLFFGDGGHKIGPPGQLLVIGKNIHCFQVIQLFYSSLLDEFWRGYGDVLLLEEENFFQAGQAVVCTVNDQIHLIPDQRGFKIVGEIKIQMDFRMGIQKIPDMVDENTGAEFNSAAQADADPGLFSVAGDVLVCLFNLIKIFSQDRKRVCPAGVRSRCFPWRFTKGLKWRSPVF